MDQIVIGITAHRESEHIGKTIESAWVDTVIGTTKKLIICANDSDPVQLDETVDAIQAAVRRLRIPPHSIKIIKRPVSNRPSAVNAILNHAWVNQSVELVLLTGDVVLQRHTLSRLHRALQEDLGLYGVGAKIQPSRRARLVENVADIPHQVAGFSHLDGKCMMLRGYAVPLIGTIPPSVLNDDLFISLRLGKEHTRRVQGATVVYHPPETLREAWDQAVRQWRGVIQLRRLFGKKRVAEFVDPSVGRALARGLQSYSKLRPRQRTALLVAPLFYSGVKMRSAFGKKSGGTWKSQATTKRLH